MAIHDYGSVINVCVVDAGADVGGSVAQPRGQQMCKEADRNWLERSVAADFGCVSTAAKQQARAFVSSGLVVGSSWRRLALLSIPIVLLVASIFLLPPADYLPEGNRNLVLWLTEPFQEPVSPEAVELSAPAREFSNSNPKSQTHFCSFPSVPGYWCHVEARGGNRQWFGGHGRTVDWEELWLSRLSLYVSNSHPIFNDPGKEFEGCSSSVQTLSNLARAGYSSLEH